MNGIEISLVVLVWTLFTCWVTTQNLECPTDWFGSNCQFKCRCLYGSCDNEGLCADDDTCMRGWFGPACQYVDLAYNKSIVRETTDADDDTCVRNRKLTIVTVQFSGIFTWLRVFIRKPKYKQELQFMLKYKSSVNVCNNSRNASVGDNLLDMYCPNIGVVEELIITGRGVRYLCSVYISGGRNLALKQSTSQSTTYTHPFSNMSYVSDLAVDGNTGAALYESKTCTHTKLYSDVTAYWSLTMADPVHVSRYVIYNRMDVDLELADRLKHFTLEAFNKDEKNVFSFTDSNPEAQAVYTILNESVDVKVVAIICGHSFNVLTLCEVEVYGDSMCDHGHYGRQCEKQCNCFGYEHCFVSSGACPLGCASGYQGENCSTRSSAGTLKNKAIFRTGLAATLSSISVLFILVIIVVVIFSRRKGRASQSEESDSEVSDNQEDDEKESDDDDDDDDDDV